MLKKMRIKKRLSVAFIMVTGITSIAAVVGCIAMLYISSQYAYALDNYGFAQGDIGKVMTAFAEARSSTRTIIGFMDADAINNALKVHDEKKAEFEQLMDSIEPTLTTQEEREIFKNIKSRTQEFWKVDAEVIAVGNTLDDDLSRQAQKKATAELAPIFDDCSKMLEELMEFNVNHGNELERSLATLRVVLLAAIIVVVVISVIISTLLGSRIASGIAAPLGKLSGRLKQFAEGGLSEAFPEVDSEDEVSDMVKAAAAMAENLSAIIEDAGQLMGEMSRGNYAISSKMEERYVGEFSALMDSMRTMNQQMNSTLRQIDDASKQVSAGSTNLAEGAQSLAEGATEQAGAIEELQATISNITDGVKKTAESTDASYRQAQQYAKEAERSREEMQAMMHAMERISETSSQIGAIISDIEDIATQTNLLSLNASIEAARAGEAGRGFAVVADQIGKLAEQSASSAVDTRQLIENAIQEVNVGNQAVDRAAGAIGTVVEGVNVIAEASKEQRDMSKEQAEAMKQAEIGLNQISEVVQSNSATAEESSATSEELSAQAESLSELVSRFKLK